MESNEFEDDVIDRLARIETEQKLIQQEVTDIRGLESRISRLEGELNQRKGRTALFNSLLIMIGAGIGSVIAVLVSRLLS